MNVLEKYNAKSVEAWYKGVSLGKWLYVMRWVFVWGTPMFIVVGLIFPFLGLGGSTDRSFSSFLFSFTVFHLCGALLGFFMWHYNLRKYGTTPDDV